MESQRLWTTIVAVLALSTVGPHSPRVWAQEASCLPGREWNQNSFGRDPCTIASRLEATCRGVGSYTVPPLDGSGEYYEPPEKSNSLDLKCECNTVTYSLYGACTSCQNGEIISWTTWSTNCSAVNVTQYPYDISPGTAIPRWAFIDVTTLPNQTYSDAVAIAVGRDPEATPSPTSVGSSRTSSMLTSSSAPSPTRTGVSPNNLKGRFGIIVGSAVGGGVALIILAVVVALVVRRQRRSRGQPVIEETLNNRPGSPTRASEHAIKETSSYYMGSPTLTMNSVDSTYSTHRKVPSERLPI